jgi:hypothetical protein
MGRIVRSLTAAAVALTLFVPGVACAATPASKSAPAGSTTAHPEAATATAAGAGATTRSYTASSADFANPGRGFFTYTETHFSRSEPYDALDAAELAQARTGEAHSIVYRIFYLEKYQSVDTIDAADLALIRADFATARAAGVKLVVRFAYTSTSSADAPLARVLKHISQLKPILTSEADLIVAVQAGFVGRWGEWYYTDNFPATGKERGQVLNALLAATTAPVQVRTPQIKRTLAPTSGRVGIHDDCFLAGDDDYGTFTGDDRAWLARQTALVGGETCDPSDRSGWADARAEMAAYHWTYLNPSFNTDVLDSWGAAGRAEASRKLGYRLRLIDATLPTSATRGAKISVRLRLTNDGYAAPIANRKVLLTFNGGAPVAIGADLRTWQPGTPVTVTATVTAPAKAGDYALALSLPDPSARLAATPAYAIRLADDGVWNAAAGSNQLGVTLRIR